MEEEGINERGKKRGMRGRGREGKRDRGERGGGGGGGGEMESREKGKGEKKEVRERGKGRGRMITPATMLPGSESIAYTVPVGRRITATVFRDILVNFGI